MILLLYLPSCLFLHFSLLLHLLELLQCTLNTKTNTKMLKKSIERQRKWQRIAQWKYSNIAKKIKFNNSLLSSGTQQGRRRTRKETEILLLAQRLPGVEWWGSLVHNMVCIGVIHSWSSWHSRKERRRDCACRRRRRRLERLRPREQLLSDSSSRVQTPNTHTAQQKRR